MTAAMGIALTVRIRARHRQDQTDRLWLHPATAGVHVVSMTLDRAGSEVYSVATCRCRWSSRVEISEIASQDAIVDGHWRDVIADAGGVAA
jgi:hypothetical protein